MILKSKLSLKSYETLDIKEKINYAKSIVDLCISIAAKKFKAIIAVNPINPASYQLLLAGMVPKAKELTYRTSSVGLFQGYILNNPNEKSAYYIPLKNKRLQAIRRNDQELWIESDQVKLGDEVVSALANNIGEYITSDIDILLIANRLTVNQEVFFEPDYGYITEYELKIVKFINQTYSDLTSEYNQKKRDCYIITHGPYNRHKKSYKDELKFPVQIFSEANTTPLRIGNDITSSLQQLEGFLQQNSNYNFYIPDHWK